MKLYKKKFLSISIFIIVSLLISVTFVFRFQKPYTNIEHRLQWWLEEINWEVEQREYTGKNIKIALLDTGVDTSHPDLAHADIKSLKTNSVLSVNDDKSHGTAIAGILAGMPSTSKGVLGIAPNATIISIDITDQEYVTAQNIIDGIKMAICEDVDIISISLGLKENNPQVHKAIKEAYDKGIIIVASSGNYMENDVLYPAKYDEVLCVGAYGKKGNIISPKGNVKKTTIYLPGENIVTTNAKDKQYLGANGTSFSAAILSGTVILMKEANPQISSQAIYDYFNSDKTSINFDINQCISFSKEN